MLEIELLDRAKKITGSDYKTAQRLGTSPQRLSNIRAGRRHMDEWIAGRIAELEGKKPWEAICALRAEQAKNWGEMKDWKRWAGAAVVMLSTALFCASGFDSVSYAGMLPLIVVDKLQIMHIWG